MWVFNDLSCQWLAVMVNNALEWTAGEPGLRLAAAPASQPARGAPYRLACHESEGNL